MRTKFLICGLLASSMLAGTAVAQSPAPAPAAPAATAPSATGVTTSSIAAGGQWRASKLVGLDVYNEQKEKLGDVSEVLVDTTGKVTGMVIGVGGFLGMGQRDVLVSMEQLQFVHEPMRTTTSTPPAGGTATTTTRPTTTTSASNDNQWYPDHAILAGVNRDQLKAMPEFRYN